MWSCKNLGRGTVKFVAHGHHRTEPRKELALADWQRLQDAGLKYSGALSEEVKRKIKDSQQVKLKPEVLQAPQQPTDTQHVPPVPDARPPLVTSSTEKSGFRLSLGGVKRKQSFDLDPQEKQGSPKAPKLSRQQTPTDRAQSPIAKDTPLASHRRSSTPKARGSVTKPKGSKTVVLRLGSKAAKAQALLSMSPESRPIAATIQLQAPKPSSRSITPILPQPPPAFPSALPLQSPTNGFGHFDNAAFSGAAPNLGSFRSYDPPAEAELPPASIVKQEHFETTQSPITASPINVLASPFQDERPNEPAATDDIKQEMPPPPRPKLTLKLGGRRTSAQGSPN